ncbi:MAG: hypothetical protein K9N35_09120 [Candidatus Marinimicrobia bacterium]|nr:hypothetical protein [Candidatus Neomarinimicrobiota bacterium]
MHKAHQQSTESVWERFYQSPYSRIAGFAVAAGLVAAIGLNIWIEPIGPGSSNSNFTEKKINPTAVYANRPDSIGLGNDSLQLQPGKINSDGSVLKLVSDKK